MQLPILELMVGSLGSAQVASRDQVLREMGYANPKELRAMRVAEDLGDDPRVLSVMAEYFNENFWAAWDKNSEMDWERLQDVIQIISEQLKGIPSISRLRDQKQLIRTDKRQPKRWSRHYWTTGSSKAGKLGWVEGPWDATVRRPYDMTYDLEKSLGIR